MSNYEAQAAHAPLPGPGIAVAVPNAVSSAAQDLSAFLGKYVYLVATVKTHIRAGTASVGAASATDVWFPPDLPAQFKVTANKTHIRVFGASAAGVLAIAEVQDD